MGLLLLMLRAMLFRLRDVGLPTVFLPLLLTAFRHEAAGIEDGAD